MKNKSVVTTCRRALRSTAISGVQCLIVQDNFLSDAARDEFEKAITTHGTKLLEVANETNKGGSV